MLADLNQEYIDCGHKKGMQVMRLAALASEGEKIPEGLGSNDDKEEYKLGRQKLFFAYDQKFFANFQTYRRY